MKEEFLHYVWQFQKFNSQHLRTADGKKVQVIKVGQWNHHAGPDFSMAEIVIENEKWFGHVEIHLKSSDWLQHGHQTDPNYNTVILHVVWEHNQEIKLPNGGTMPVLELKDRVGVGLLAKYEGLVGAMGKFIPCENELNRVPEFIWTKWLERLFLERLEKKCLQLKEWLEETNYHWEAVGFYALARVFGMKVNSDAFVSITKSVDFKIFQKCRSHPVVLEALLLGRAGLLEEPLVDPYYQSLQATHKYLIRKFNIEPTSVIRPQYFRLRPNNFPTIRLSQLAVLWSSIPNLVSAIRSVENRLQAYELFSVESSPYWKTHYRFGNEAKEQPKKLSKNFIDLILINVVLPFQFLYGQRQGRMEWEKIESLARAIPMERNKLLSQYQRLIKVEENAWNGQALLQLNKNYCKQINCLSCEVGNFFLKNS